MFTSRSRGGPAKRALAAAVLSAFRRVRRLPTSTAASARAASKEHAPRGHVDLQGRPSYQPNVIVYPDGRTIAFAGTHGGSKPNPLNRAARWN